jgi:hypothetical protein
MARILTQTELFMIFSSKSSATQSSGESATAITSNVNKQMLTKVLLEDAHADAMIAGTG